MPLPVCTLFQFSPAALPLIQTPLSFIGFSLRSKPVAYDGPEGLGPGAGEGVGLGVGVGALFALEALSPPALHPARQTANAAANNNATLAFTRLPRHTEERVIADLPDVGAIAGRAAPRYERTLAPAGATGCRLDSSSIHRLREWLRE